MSYLTIYNASAGSGKTFTIAAEYISLLLSGENNMHRRILAVTFTNKATEEMKERIRALCDADMESKEENSDGQGHSCSTGTKDE